MITEDQLEQLAIQWFQDTGGENVEILWLELKESRTFKKGRGVLRIFAGYCGNTRFPQPIQH
jgi:hypothetical protein